MKNRNYVNDANLVSLLITLNLFQTFFRLEQIACSMPIWRVWAHKTSETHSFFRRIQFFLHGCFFFVFWLVGMVPSCTVRLNQLLVSNPRKLRTRSHLMRKFLMQIFIFCAVLLF